MSGGSSTTVHVPGPSAAEQALQKEQTALLREQRDIIQAQVQSQQAMLPFIADQMGLDITMNEAGVITSVTARDDPMNAQRQNIEQMLLDRTEQALKGELPVDPALERSLETQEQTLRDRLHAQFGPGFETSTPGIQTMDEFFRSAESLRHGARTAQLTLAEQLGLAREQQGMARQGFELGMFRQSALGDPANFAQMFGQNAAGFNPILGRMQGDRSMQLQGNIANAQMANQRSMATMLGFGQLTGSLFGAAAGAGGFGQLFR